jgi:hypothetical protein
LQKIKELEKWQKKKHLEQQDYAVQTGSQLCLAIEDANGKKFTKKIGSFSLIERVILSAGAMLIFSVSFQIDQMSEDVAQPTRPQYIPVSLSRWWPESSHKVAWACRTPTNLLNSAHPFEPHASFFHTLHCIYAPS